MQYARFAAGVVLLQAIVLLVGCQSSLGPTANRYMPKTVLAATAGGSQYPQNAQVSGDTPLVALTDKGGDITLINPTEQTLRDLKVWVNETYVQPLNILAMRGMITLQRENFYDSKGNSMSQAKAEPKSIAIQTGDGKMMRVYGPVLR